MSAPLGAVYLVDPMRPRPRSNRAVRPRHLSIGWGPVLYGLGLANFTMTSFLIGVVAVSR